MTDIGAVWKRSAAVERALLTGWLSALVLTAGSAQASVGSAIPFPRNDVSRRIAAWVASTIDTVFGLVRTSSPHTEPRRRHYHARPEGFIEDAAMSREMYRL